MEQLGKFPLELFQHEKDRKLILEVMNHQAVKKMLECLKTQRIEEVYQYAYRVSCIRITERTAPVIYSALKYTCRLFGADPVPKLFLNRDYDQTIQLCGMSEPFLVISSAYLEKIKVLGEDMLLGVFASQAAGIAAGHHRGLMLSWMLENGMKWFSLPAPLAFGLDALQNDWKRSRIYTCDRAFLLAVRDFSLTIRSMFINILPGDILDNFGFGTEQDAYIPQMEQFLHASETDSILKAANSMVSDTAWLPQRYKEIKAFYRQSQGG